MRTDCEFKRQHRGHWLHTEGKEFPDGMSIFWGGAGPNPVGRAKCPLCNVEEEVIVTRKICEHHDYGRHIKLECTKCGRTGTTKNISSIGSRTIFVDCACSIKYLVHICDVDNGG